MSKLTDALDEIDHLRAVVAEASKVAAHYAGYSEDEEQTKWGMSVSAINIQAILVKAVKS